jgi:hypothetical protein
MITRDEIRELAQFQVATDDAYAISFYFQPRTPQNKSHRGEVIEAKDMVSNALREIDSKGRKNGARADLDRILELAGDASRNHTHAKAIFACHAHNFWREYSLPPRLTASQLLVNRRFQLKPLAQLAGAQPRVWVALADRRRARIFDFRLEELKEREAIFGPLPRRGRSDGFRGYDGGHAERRVEDDVLHHYKLVAEHLKDANERGLFDRLIVGCQDANWPDLEPQLHSYVKRALLGRFSAEVATISDEQVQEKAQAVLEASLDERRRTLVQQALSHARSHHRGVTGLRRVLRSLELGEVQTLLMGDNYRAHAVECTNCGHLDAHMVRFCPVCGRATRELEDVSEAIVPAAIRRDVELFYVRDNPDFDRAGNIAALLRFRVDQARSGPFAAAV